jgi:hypothetical protein
MWKMREKLKQFYFCKIENLVACCEIVLVCVGLDWKIVSGSLNPVKLMEI